jgi:hypothetical protein
MNAAAREAIMAQIWLHLAQADGYLPAVCMRCGKPATTTQTKRMSWHPPWVGGIIALAMTRYATLQAPFCDKHKGHWFKWGMLLWGSFFLFLLLGGGALVIALSLPPRATDTALLVVGIGCGLLGLIWLVILVVCLQNSIRTAEITDEEISLTGVAEEFVEAVAEEERARRKRRRQRRRERERPGHWRDEADDDDDLPRPRRRRDDDRFEE